MREWESRLGAASVNLADWDRYLKRIGEQGIEINTVAELESDPKRDRMLYELERQRSRGAWRGAANEDAIRRVSKGVGTHESCARTAGLSRWTTTNTWR